MSAGAALGLIHLQQPGSPSRHVDLRRRRSCVRVEILHLHARRSSCAFVASVDYGSLVSKDGGIHEAGWGWFLLYAVG